MGKGLLQKAKHKRGYTLMEVLLVVGIIAIICAIAIPSIISISRSLSFKQKNDYAKAIFMAAQANLTEMKDDSELEKAVESALFTDNKAWMRNATGNYEEHKEYIYASSDFHPDLYKVVLPIDSVESTVRNQHVIIEFNPKTANVYSVFYWEKDDQTEYEYKTIAEIRDNEEKRKDLQLGYYNGSEVVSETLEEYPISSKVSFVNGPEGLVVVELPTVYVDQASGQSYPIMEGEWNRYMKGIEVRMSVRNDQGGTIKDLKIKAKGEIDSKHCFPKPNDDGTPGNVICITYSLDSLIDGGSFANLSGGVEASLTTIEKEDQFKILPGDNVSISVDVTFTPSGNDPIINIESAAIAGVNPMFHSLTENPDKGKEGEKDYILAISNARNLQNLNALAPSIAEQVESVVFVENEKSEMRIDWGELVDYYNTNYGIGTNKQYSNDSAEAPARGLPYFVPIQNANLFGKGTFSDDATYTLQDRNTSADYAAIEGNGVKIYDLNMDAAKLTNVPAAYYACLNRAAAEGESGYHAVSYDFTGLFSYVNTSVKGINIVNPRIIGADFTTYANPATGALIGAAGVSTQVTGCGVYIDTADDGFDRGLLNLSNFQGANNQYGVSGHGAVGGLVGYARSEREATNEKTGVLKDASGTVAPDMSVITFAKCFAAVPVYGEMKTSGSYGYTNGVGGLIGNSQLTNFFGCYASGNVTVKNATHGDKLTTGKIEYLGIDLPGATSWGAGGFVGTSHGTCYTNCFATGNVSGDDYGMGGFVGIICYDSVSGAQHTVFTNCYAVGTVEAEVTVDVKVDGQDVKKQQMLIESFSGGNARNKTDSIAVDTPVEGTNYADYTVWAEGTPYQAYYLFNNSWFLGKYQGANGNGTVQTSLNGEENGEDNTTVDTSEIYSIKCANSATYAELTTEVGGNGRFDGIDVWRMNSASETHPYEITYEGRAYPFAMLAGMDYYGDWPARPAAVGIAYYEVYNASKDGVKYEYGYYFDSHSSSTLRNNELSVWDGYAVLYSDTLKSVTINGAVFDVGKSSETADEIVSFGDNSYYVYRMTDAMIKKAAETQNPTSVISGEADYYTTVSVSVSESKIYTLYFNPNVALSQVNPVGDKETAVKPKTSDGKTEIPKQIYIRTARQINAVAENMKHYWGEECHYIQLVDIDFSLLYDYTEVNQATVQKVTAVAPIGNDATAFDGTYTATGENQLLIAGHIPAVKSVIKDNGIESDTVINSVNAGIFGVVGEKATISNLIIVPDNEVKSGTEVSNITEIKSDSNSVTLTNAGLLAGTNRGTIENVDVLINDGVTVKADANNLGLLVGINNGSITGSDVLFNEDTTPNDNETAAELTVDSNGGIVGLLVGYNDGHLTGCNAAGTVISADPELKDNKKDVAVTIYGFTGGALVGASLGGTITDCSVAEDFFAIADANFEGVCYYSARLALTYAPAVDSADAVDTDNSVDNVYGGLIGAAQNTTIKSSATGKYVEVNLGSATAENATFGGAIGVADVCEISNVNVTIGEYIDNVTLSVTIGHTGSILANNAAGLSGAIRNTDVRDSTVDLIGTIHGTQYASGAIGGVSVDSAVENVAVTFCKNVMLTNRNSALSTNCGIMAGDKNTEEVVGSAAGFAVESSGIITNCYVSGSVTIFGEEKSAGFVIEADAGEITGCVVTPTAVDGTSEDYGNTNNSELMIGQDTTVLSAQEQPISVKSAGFILNNVKLAEGDESVAGADITNCMALGSVYGTETAGFVANNRGTIRTSICNVNMASGNVFADTNSGLIENCYGWSTEGRADEIALSEGDTNKYYVSSYFAVMSPEEDEPAVVLYEADGVLSETITDYIALMSDEAMTALMGFNDNDRPQTNSPWLHSSSTVLHTYAYTMSGSYPYPMLRHHYGDWAEPFGVLYYEVYEDQSIGVKMADLAQLTEIRYTSTLADKMVSDAGYAVFVKKDKAGALLQDETNAVEDEPMALAEAASLYAAIGDPTGTSYALYVIEIPNGQSASTINFNYGGLTGHNVTVHPLFADTFDVVGTEQKPAIYSLRTKKQLEAAKTIPGTYLVDRTIRVSDNFVPTLTADVTIRIQDGCQIIKSDGNPVAFETPIVPDGTVSASQNMETDETVTEEP